LRKNSFLNPVLGYARSGLMPTDPTTPLSAEDPGTPETSVKRRLPPAAERALAEAAARRATHDREKTDAPKEVAGRGGLDPARYGDWEINGLIADF
jgi:hypothetical protein